MPLQFSFIRRVLSPADKDTKQLLREKWASLPAALQTPQQMYGLNEEGCGATVGLMPLCNFACKACYLNDQANRTPAASLDEIHEQIQLLRNYLGRGGNLQLTDGEVTLRNEEELHTIIRYAIECELIPMIMTHGDTFLKDPGLLYRLVQNSGLREVSFHIDSTQRGRFDQRFKYASSEQDLMPLREQFARLIRSVKQKTGYSLRAASTVTVTPENIDEIPTVVDWFMRNSDAFRLLSFQPVADVGRTKKEVSTSIYVDLLWGKIEEGLGESGFAAEESQQSQWWMGHPDCNRFIFGYAFHLKNGKRIYKRLSSAPSDIASKVLRSFYRTWPGVTFRADSKTQAIARALGMLLTAPRLIAYEIPLLFFRLCREVSSKDLPMFFFDLIQRKTRLHRLTIVSHHFMSNKEVNTKKGQERLKSCVFMVPSEGQTRFNVRI